jgi:acetyl-CoA carboxylase biotin carboxylase subunit
MNKILVANRGEIALRVMRSAREMGITTVAIYSEADRDAPFVRYADEAVCVGPPPSNESYLRGDKIIQVCKDLGVQGVHPGYGFLSENADFARNLTDAGITLIGPPPEAMEIMGDKLAAKAAVKNYNIPMVPGTDGEITDVAEARVTAAEIGYPVLIKASAGGGGKGMRVVKRDEDFVEQMNLAVNEAVSSFGNGAVFIERYVGSPKHIEIQVLADNHGNVVYLHERECSVQRRHQKVVEEAPSPVISPELRKKMGESACDVARSCNYTGAGTVEFLYEKGEYFFLEMNTRLQVEHPVTELITGIDLVKEQIKVARGEKLSFKQEDIKINGHAVEVRVYAEDPQNNFLPDIGTLQTYQRPQGLGIRVDDGFEEGMSIPIYYDPMISKLITHGATREEAIERMVRAIDDYVISGVETTLKFCKFVIQHEEFLNGKFDTHFVEKYFTDPSILDDSNDEEATIATLFAAKLITEHKPVATQAASTSSKAGSKWKMRARA